MRKFRAPGFHDVAVLGGWGDPIGNCNRATGGVHQKALLCLSRAGDGSGRRERAESGRALVQFCRSELEGR